MKQSLGPDGGVSLAYNTAAFDCLIVPSPTQAHSYQHELVTLKETLENEKAKYARFAQQIKGIVTPSATSAHGKDLGAAIRYLHMSQL